MRLLLVEDEPDIAEIILEILQAEGYNVDLCATGDAAEEAAYVEEYDLFVLDRMLPDIDGLTLCAILREAHPSTPILMLTSLSEPDYRVEGLDAGADDYLGKPFHPKELTARVRALLRRNAVSRTPVLRCGKLTLDPERHEVRIETAVIALYPKEYAILEYMMRNSGKIRTQQQIGESVWGSAYEPNSNIVESHISRVRRKLEAEGLTGLIQTIKGVGYKIMDQQ
ncbi:MAG: response regulator transcription factor [Candidatus Kapaibacterium sp.]